MAPQETADLSFTSLRSLPPFSTSRFATLTWSDACMLLFGEDFNPWQKLLQPLFLNRSQVG